MTTPSATAESASSPAASFAGPFAGPFAGQVQLWSRTLIPTAKEPPADAEAISHQLLARGGFIRRVGAGIYNYLPLGHRVVQKVAQIVREEMNAAGASELFLPHITPVEGYFSQTGRADDYGDLLFRFTDRHGRDTALGPTHEEVITGLMQGCVTSYKSLPLNVYQIQTKFRDEFRPRAGLLRGREFLMKDAYSFHMGVEGEGGLNKTYDAMYQAYENIFTRCGLDFSAVEAEAGPIGGSASHEFMVNADSGEDTILVCQQSGYAANVEKCEIGQRYETGFSFFDGEPSGDLQNVHTPDCPGIEDVCKLLKVKQPNMLKTVVFQKVDQAEGESLQFVLAVVKGNHDVNEGKVRDAVGFAVELADEKLAREAGFAIGYVSPKSLLNKNNAIMLVDEDAAQGTDIAKGKAMFWVTGADKKDHHVKHFNWRREMGDILSDETKVKVAEIRNAAAGDPSPRAQGSTLAEKRGIEVGHIFKLGDKYSKAMGFAVLDENQQQRHVIMGCYGIGVSRVAASCVEMSHDDFGIIWPKAIAPYQVLITVLQPDEALLAQAKDIAAQLAVKGADVLIDDRDERPGFKFKDADLIGIPSRITVSNKANDAGGVEFKGRTDSGKGEVVSIDEAISRCSA